MSSRALLLSRDCHCVDERHVQQHLGDVSNRPIGQTEISLRRKIHRSCHRTRRLSKLNRDKLRHSASRSSVMCIAIVAGYKTTSKIPRKRQRMDMVTLPHHKPIRQITSSLPARMLPKVQADEEEEGGHITSPVAFIRKTMRCNGAEVDRYATNVLSEKFFDEPTKANYDSYGHDLIDAVRKRDIDTLRRIHLERERSLQSCNQFGESLIHMACRRGFTDVALFLIKEAGISIRVRDDGGRTPLHDACWACEPNTELMEVLIAVDPELLLVSDKRGHTPFEYVRKEHWDVWLRFLNDKRDLLVPTAPKGP